MSENLKNRSQKTSSDSKNLNITEKETPQNAENILIKYFQNYMTDIGGGPKLFKMRYTINFQKGATFIFILLLMKYYNNYSLGAFLYLALHGSYGIFWIIKDCIFGDKGFERPSTICSFVGSAFFLAGYWYIPFMQISGQGIQNPSVYRTLTAILMYVFGVNIMMISDCQKYFTLKYKKGLISDGMFYVNRNPNYLGEIMLYASFAVLVGKWTPWFFLLTVWLVFFNLNMYLKDEASLKKKEGWEEYSKRSSKILFKVFKNDILHFSMYGVLVALGYLAYSLIE